MLIHFRRPLPTTGEAGSTADELPSLVERHVFPPVVRSNATYSRGILLSDASISHASDGGGLAEVAVDVPGDYIEEEDRSLPILGEEEALNWSHGMSSHAAVHRRSPMQIGRHVGTVTLLFDESHSKTKDTKLGSLMDHARKYNCRFTKKCGPLGLKRTPSHVVKFSKTLTRKQAVALSLAENGHDVAQDVSALSDEEKSIVERRAESILLHWKRVKGSTPLKECWNTTHGGFVSEMVNDPAFVPIAALLSWMKGRKSVHDRFSGRVSSLYGDLRTVKTDARTICESILDLSCPRSIYKIPLLTPYAVARRSIVGKVTTWTVTVGIYINRLLPEMLTSDNLHVVMSSLDEGSYIVSEPLHLPPAATEKVFESAPCPVVTIHDQSGDRVDLLAEEEKKEEEKETGVVDPTVENCTRDSSTVSAFTAKGLLKLLESTGCDTSNWSALEARLRPYLKLELMLHQRHAVCWMAHMESLGGFGLNSIIWEEREFADGGKYYYSPALGQLRLDKPPTTVGGCVADEMGLGKTLEMLSLIASSLDELRQEAVRGGDDFTHATLIVVPPALVRQWYNEITKSCGTTLKANILDANATDAHDFEELISSKGNGADILITTYSALEKPRTSRFLSKWTWGRVVLDEQQEIRSDTTRIARNCEGLDCHRRWMMSGTPIFSGIEDLRGELNFLRLSPYAAKLEDGFFNFSILSHWDARSLHGLDTLRILGMLLLRRSKDMTVSESGRSIMDSRKLTINLVPVSQDASERALYCWMEFLLSQVAKTSKSDMGLRFLHELCFSPTLLNGGLGCPSQLKDLNDLYRTFKKIKTGDENLDQEPKAKRPGSTTVMSPDEARNFLSALEQSSKTVGSEFVSDQRFGRGQGASLRNHAMDSIDEQIADAEQIIVQSTRKAATLRSRRAKARWHVALELVTTGKLRRSDMPAGVSIQMVDLWLWRAQCISQGHDYGNRGWRPSSIFARDLLLTRPTFVWLNPYCYRLARIPDDISLDEIRLKIFESIKGAPRLQSKLNLLRKRLEKVHINEEVRIKSAIVSVEQSLETARAADQLLEQPVVSAIGSPLQRSQGGDWGAFLHVTSEEPFSLLEKSSKSKHGIPIARPEMVPRTLAVLKNASDAYETAVAEYNVHPCAGTTARRSDALKIFENAKVGLTIKYNSPRLDMDATCVIMSKATTAFRDHKPKTASALIDRADVCILESNRDLETALARLKQAKKDVNRFAFSKNRDIKLTQRSAHGVLDLINRKSFSQTHCAICYGPFGEAHRQNPEDEVVTAMLKCGHLFCIGCVEEYRQRKELERQVLKCPSCRQDFHLRDVIHIDHIHKPKQEMKAEQAKREQAKATIREASDMLSSSDGVLDGDLWESLYRSIDLPVGIDARSHGTYTALDPNFFAHLRSACALNAASKPSDTPCSIDDGLSSKLRALLVDLPQGEHAVVFSTSKVGVLHLETVLNAKSIPVFSIHVGQKAEVTELAVTSWQNEDLDSKVTGPVLIVQAGAAASGLTLTAACKLFLLEPFQRIEEEQQAYGRLHRYGQSKDVFVKVYYAPVSVESRLLRWRKTAAQRMDAAALQRSGNGHLLTLKNEFEGDETSSNFLEDGGEDANWDGESMSLELAEDNLRRRFLIGLVDENGNPTGGRNEEDLAEEEYHRQVSRASRSFVFS